MFRKKNWNYFVEIFKNSFSVLECSSILKRLNVLEFINNGFSVLEFLNNDFTVLDCVSVLECFICLGSFSRVSVLDLANVLGSPIIYKYSSPILMMIPRWFLKFDTIQPRDSCENNFIKNKYFIFSLGTKKGGGQKGGKKWPKGGPERAKRGAKRRGHLSSTPVYIHSIVNFYFKKLWSVFKHGVYMTLTSYSIFWSLNFLLLSTLG